MARQLKTRKSRAKGRRSRNASPPAIAVDLSDSKESDLERSDYSKLLFPPAPGFEHIKKTIQIQPGGNHGVKALILHYNRPVAPVKTVSLGWTREGSSADKAFYNLNSRIPDDLKYGLHQLFIQHRQTCNRCRTNSTKTPDDSLKQSNECVLEHLLDRHKTPANGKAKTRSHSQSASKGVKSVLMSKRKRTDSDAVNQLVTKRARRG
jgi:hypothetical protein